MCSGRVESLEAGRLAGSGCEHFSSHALGAVALLCNISSCCHSAQGAGFLMGLLGELNEVRRAQNIKAWVGAEAALSHGYCLTCWQRHLQ